MANKNDFNIVDFCNVVKTCNIDVIQSVLKKHGIPKGQPGVNDYLLLQSLLRNKLLKTAKLLISAGCRINPTSSETGLTPLGLAFTYEYIEIAKLLLKHGATEYTDNTKTSTVLHLAATMKSMKMFLFICKYGNVHSHDSNGRSALQILFENRPFSFDHKVGKNKIEMIRQLLMKGASVDFISSNGKTALHYVASLKQKDIITFVLKRTVNVNLCDDQQRTALHYLLNSDYKSENSIYEILELFIAKGARIDIGDRQKVTVAHLAAKNKYLQILKKFLQCQCNVSLQDCRGNTVLHEMLKNSAHLSGKEDFINLFSSILSTAPLENVQNSSGDNLLHLAAKNYHREILIKMLPKCKDVNIRDGDYQQTLLHILAKQFSKENLTVIRLLLSAGANVDIKNLYDITPVDIAMKIGNKDLLIPLLQRSKNLNQFFDRKSILHYVSEMQIDSESEELELTKIVISCIQQGLNVDVLDGSARTPLCMAVFNRCKSLVKILLDCGANPNFNTSMDIIKCIAARSPVLNIDLEIADILISKGARIVVNFDNLLILLKKIDSHDKIIKLLDHCETLNYVDLSGNTVLHAFLSNNTSKDKVFQIFKAYLKLFLSKGVSIDAKNKDNLTLIDLAVKNNHSLVYELLLKNSATGVFQKIAGVLPDECTEKIFKFLSNQDLINLIQTAQLKNLKRKSTGLKIERTRAKRLQR